MHICACAPSVTNKFERDLVFETWEGVGVGWSFLVDFEVASTSTYYTRMRPLPSMFLGCSTQVFFWMTVTNFFFMGY